MRLMSLEEEKSIANLFQSERAKEREKNTVGERGRVIISTGAARVFLEGKTLPNVDEQSFYLWRKPWPGKKR